MQGTRPCGVCGEGETQFCNGPEVFCTSSYDAGCVICVCPATNPGAIQDFMFLQELLVGAEPPTLMFTVEICLRE